MKKLILAAAVLFISVQSIFSQNVQMTERLFARMNSLNPVEYTRVLILLKDRIDIEKLDRDLYQMNAPIEYRAETVINTLRNKAAQTQGPILSYLNSEKESGKIKQLMNFWLTNLIFIECTPDVIYNLTKRMDVDILDLDAELDIDRPYDEQPAVQSSQTIENGLRVIKADSLWKIGITGAGRTVMNIDGGVNGTHPALSSRWWGNNGRAWYHSWYDPISPFSTSPFDCATGGTYHGTHTMGIMCGRNSATGDTVGVAPDARWMAAGITDCPGASYPSMNIAAYQWAMDPDSNSATMDMPDVINCSWRDPTATNECTSSIYRTVLPAVEAIGTAVIFSAGNSGPGASTITPPKNINIDSVEVFCVGNISGTTLNINSSSSRGPSLCGGTGTLLIKPEVVAPGSSIRSTWSGTSYGTISGTSMAAPHVAGSIALLKQVAPGMTGKQLKAILLSTATDLGTAGEDNSYGRGLINVNRAYHRIISAPPAVSNISFIQEGFYNTVSNRLNMNDTVKIYLRNNISPYNIVDSAKGILDSVSFTAQVTFANALTGTYYLQLKHRNSLETWSRSGGEGYSRGDIFNYDFTAAQNRAFGNNMTLKGVKYVIYSGDVNQDGTIDLSDGTIIDNDASVFAVGYIVSDVNGDSITDITDAVIADNNAAAFVSKVTP